MTAHKLAEALLKMPDLPVVINGWGSGEGDAYEVTQPAGHITDFLGVGEPFYRQMEKPPYRPCVILQHEGSL